MVVKVENQISKTDIWLWVGVVALVFAGIGSNFYLFTHSLLSRVILVLSLETVAFILASKTVSGRKVWRYWQESVLEVKKIVWPSRKETLQTTLSVLAMVFVMGLLLWSVDAILIRCIGWLVCHNGV